MSDAAGTRCVALVGPYLSGKTTLLESLLFVSGGIHRRGSVKEGNSVGDSAAEARTRQMSVELSVGSTEYLGENWTILDCPGSIDLLIALQEQEDQQRQKAAAAPAIGATLFMYLLGTIHPLARPDCIAVLAGW